MWFDGASVPGSTGTELLGVTYNLKLMFSVHLSEVAIHVSWRPMFRPDWLPCCLQLGNRLRTSVSAAHDEVSAFTRNVSCNISSETPLLFLALTYQDELAPSSIACHWDKGTLYYCSISTRLLVFCCIVGNAAQAGSNCPSPDPRYPVKQN